jgi:hypothetical protein
MTIDDATTDATPTLSLEAFWDWLVMHPNCILRAGTQETVIYDDDDLHWHFAAEGSDTWLVQLIRGKRLVGEILVVGDHVAYVQGTPGDHEGEYVFELITETETERLALYFFVLSHAYEVQEPLSSRPVH